jgi:hypothetical protein
MPETGSSWARAVEAHAAQAREARTWAASRLAHEDAAQLAGELFIAVLATQPSKVTVTVSTAGTRARIAATGDQEMSRLSIHSPGGGIVRALATSYGTTPDDRGLWAEVNLDRTT